MNRILYFFLLIFLYPLSLLPLKVLYVFSDFLSFIIMRVCGYRKGVIYTNLARSFPDLKYNEIKKITREFDKNLIDIFIEALWSFSSSTSSIRKRVHLDSDGIDIINKLLERERGLIITMGHQGNWELLSSFCMIPEENHPLNFMSKDVVSIYKKIENEPVEMVMTKIRSKFGLNQLVETKDFGRFIINHKDDKLVYLFIADQAPHNGEKYVKKVLNQRTYLIHGPEYVAKKFDIPIVFLDMRRSSRGKYEVFIKTISDKPTDVEDGFITGRFADLLEESINSEKSNWLWSHKRWKREPKNTGKIVEI